MKNYISIVLIICSISIFAQKPLDTIYANDQKSVALFFPDPIRQGITGSTNFIFTYNTVTAQYFGLLQAKPGKPSNLLVINSNGLVFSYIISYRKELKKLNYFISSGKSIGNEIPKLEAKKEKLAKQDSSPKPLIQDPYQYRREYFEKFGAYLVKKKHPIQKSNHDNSILFSLKKLIYDRSEVYAIIELNNRSGIDFEVDFINFYSVNSNKRRKSSFQKLGIQPIYKYNFPKTFKNEKSTTFVVVMPKFTLGDSERLSIQLTEKNGNRELTL